MSYVKSEWVAPGQGDSAYGILRWCNALGAMVGIGEDRQGKEDGLIATKTDLRIVGDGPPCDYDYERVLEALDRCGLLTAEVLGRIDFVRRVARNPERSVVGVAGYVMALLLMILGAGSAQAADSWWLTAAAYPAIPGWSTRHVQILHETFSAGQTDAGDAHQYQRLSVPEGQKLADALLAWDGSNGTLYHRQRNVTKGVARATWKLDAVAQAGKVQIISFSVIWIEERNPYCPSCAPAQTSTHQTAVLEPEEAAALGNGLADWAAGWDPSDAIVYSRLNSAVAE